MSENKENRRHFLKYSNFVCKCGYKTLSFDEWLDHIQPILIIPKKSDKTNEKYNIFDDILKIEDKNIQRILYKIAVASNMRITLEDASKIFEDLEDICLKRQ